jgi:hypothetical protein
MCEPLTRVYTSTTTDCDGLQAAFNYVYITPDSALEITYLFSALFHIREDFLSARLVFSPPAFGLIKPDG